MRPDQLEHAIRPACQIIQQSEIIVVGSQAILGKYDESHLPAAATMSIEVDILPIADSNDQTTRLADLIEGIAGELSPFEELHGFSIDGVDLETAVLPRRTWPTPTSSHRGYGPSRLTTSLQSRPRSRGSIRWIEPRPEFAEPFVLT